MSFPVASRPHPTSVFVHTSTYLCGCLSVSLPRASAPVSSWVPPSSLTSTFPLRETLRFYPYSGASSVFSLPVSTVGWSRHPTVHPQQNAAVRVPVDTVSFETQISLRGVQTWDRDDE